MMTEAQKKKQRVPRKLTYERMERAAFHHLERFACSEYQLRSVLGRKVMRTARHHPVDDAEAQAWIDKIIAKMKDLKLIDDAEFAAMTARSMNRRGKGGRAISWSLRQKGVEEDFTVAALDELDDEFGNADLQAAVTLVRKKKLGPMRAPDDRVAFRDKDMGALARAGFSLDLARKVLDADDEAALEALLDDLD